MSVTKLTKRAVDSALPASQSYLIRDSELKGFALVVTPFGGKSYAIDYRAGRGRRARKRRLTIGKHGSPWTPETARKEALRLLGEIAAGADPAEERSAGSKEITLSELIDLYFAEGVEHKKASTLRADRSRVANHLRPLLGSRRVSNISRADAERLLADVSAGKTKRTPVIRRKRGSVTTGGKGTAAQCVVLLGTLMAFAIRRGLRTDNPAHGVKKPPVRKMQRFLSETEIAQLATALAQEEGTTKSPFPAAAIRLLLFTGCRKSEILGLKWNHVDFDHQCLRLPDSKTGAKVVFLNAPALAVLANLPRMENCQFVFVGERSNQPLLVDKVWSRVRISAQLPDVRLHDLRHSFASIGAIGGISLVVIGALLGHKHTVTTARYAHLSADPVREANEAIGKRIQAAMAGKTENSYTKLR